MLIFQQKFNKIQHIDTFEGFVIKVNKKSIILKTKHGNIWALTSQRFQKNAFVKVFATNQNLSNSDLVVNSLNYIKSYHIISVVKVENIVFIKQNKTVYYWISNFINTQPKIYQKYAKTLLLGKLDDIDLKTASLNLNIIHLFVLSGFHVNIIKKVLDFVFKNRFWSLKFNNEISLLILAFYLIILDFPIPLTRAYYFIYLTHFFTYFKKIKINKIHIYFITLNLILFHDVYLIYSISFILTFLFSFFIVLIQQIKFKKIIYKNTCFFVVLNILSFIVNSTINQQISTFFVVFNIIFGLIIPIVYVPTFIMWYLPYLLIPIYRLFDNMIGLFDKINIIIKINPIPIELIYMLLIIIISIIVYFIYKTNKKKYFVDFYV